jgi:transposase
MYSMKKSPCNDDNRTSSTDTPIPPNPFSPLVADLPLDPKILVAVIESLTRTITDLTGQLAGQSGTIIEQTVKIRELTDLVTSLAEQLKKGKSAKSNDSSNSNLPPSTSNPSKSTGNLTTKRIVKNSSLRKKTQEKPGGILGHEGSGMKLKSTSDFIVDVVPAKCTGCAHLESCKHHGTVCGKRYTRDVRISVEQTEYRNWTFRCPQSANETVTGTFPPDATGSKQYGQGIQTLVVLLRNLGIVSCSRIAKFCTSLGFSFSTGTIHAICKRFAHTCKDVKPLITDLLQSAPVLGVDETGGNVGGSKVWHHVAVSEDATLVTSHGKRGLEGTIDAGVVKDFTGVLEHDFWKPYFLLENVTHAMCCAHLERENNKAQTENPALKWPSLMNDLLHELERLRKEFLLVGLGRIPPEVLIVYLERYDGILETALAEDPFPQAGTKLKKNGEPRKPALTQAQNLLKRYQGHKDDILRFATDFDVPVSNNFSERAFRMLKTTYNVFGCFRTEGGAKDFSMVRSVLDTGRKQGLLPKDIVSKVLSKDYKNIFNDECRAILLARGAIPSL